MEHCEGYLHHTSISIGFETASDAGECPCHALNFCPVLLRRVPVTVPSAELRVVVGDFRFHTLMQQIGSFVVLSYY